MSRHWSFNVLKDKNNENLKSLTELFADIPILAGSIVELILSEQP